MTVKVDTHKGVAFHEPDDCTEGHKDCLVVVMIGDDYKWHVGIDDVHEIDDDDYCSGCGQIGCGW
jgi:hypothetical protein